MSITEHNPNEKQVPPLREEKKYWLDDRGNVKLIIYALYIVCAGLFIADFFYHKHVMFEIDSWFGFYAIYGFVMCVGLVLGAKILRTLIMRSEDYYDSNY
ncbi:MAG: hypothetical protein CMM58_06210 [Rhodospirillaceae bacterium]|nr:hypothetical protein [Rhodospirillaceae bacterium]|tara:strand:+ start:3006 stop:3305 length:300 start_codon:yes stop_codon:yes gene_type:complete